MKPASLFCLMAATVLIAACSNSATVRKSFKPGPRGNEGVVIVGTDARDPFTVHFARFDERKGKIVSGPLWFSKKQTLKHDSLNGQMQYYVMSFPAGTHVIHSTVQNLGMKRVVSCLRSGTVKFNVAPGQLVYIGDLKLAYSHVVWTGSNPQAALEAVKAYPNLDGDALEAVEPAPAKFKKC